MHKGCRAKIVDLPGTYSLSAFSPEEGIARDFIIQEKPDVVVTVLDASNLERNLYLAVQILEMEIPVVVALNMVDMAASQNIRIAQSKLSEALQSPVIRTVARKDEGTHELRDAIIETARKNT